MGEIIKVEHLQYTYPGVDDTPGIAVFEDLNLTVEQGSFVAVWVPMAAENPPLPSILIPFCCPAAARCGSADWTLPMTIS